MDTRLLLRSVLCPHCQAPFKFSMVRFVGGENDNGGWKVRCQKCSEVFKVHVRNPRESECESRWQVEEEFLDWPVDDDLLEANAGVVHNLAKNPAEWCFNEQAAPLFCCTKSFIPLDSEAYKSLKKEAKSLESAWLTAQNMLLALSGPSSDEILVRVPVDCSCGEPHSAVFYAATRLGASTEPLVDRCLLAHVSNASLESRLDCLASKSDVMELLEKLLIRWHCTSDQIFLATPFIGHQWMKPEHVEEIWNWLFKNLDPSKVTLLTRSATWKSFKNIKRQGEVSFEELERYGLEEKVVSGGAVKQDFHAKFFAGVSKDSVEVLSGSANLLRGPSIENISFSTMTPERFQARYLDILKFELPVSKRSRGIDSALIFEAGKWKHTTLDRPPWA